MTHKFSELRAKMDPEKLARIDAEAEEILAEMDRQEQRGNTAHLTDDDRELYAEQELQKTMDRSLPPDGLD